MELGICVGKECLPWKTFFLTVATTNSLKGKGLAPNNWMLLKMMAVPRVFSTMELVLCIKLHTDLQQFNKIHELSFFIFLPPEFPETMPFTSKFIGWAHRNVCIWYSMTSSERKTWRPLWKKLQVRDWIWTVLKLSVTVLNRRYVSKTYFNFGISLIR